MKTLQPFFFISLMIFILSACTSNNTPSTAPISTFKNTEECSTQLIDIISNEKNFALKKNSIFRDDLRFDIRAIDDHQELITVTAYKPENNEPDPIGKIKVNKTEQTIRNSTFGDIEALTIKLGEHTHFIADCF